MAVSCSRTSNLLSIHLLLMLLMAVTLTVGAERSYRRRVGLLRSTDRLPTDPWQLFNISITQTGNRTEGMQIVIRLEAYAQLCTVTLLSKMGFHVIAQESFNSYANRTVHYCELTESRHTSSSTVLPQIFML